MKREPREREFPYIPRGVAVLQVGRPYGADDNRAYVMSLMDARYPNVSAAYADLANGSCGEGCIVTLQDVVSDPGHEDNWGSDGGANLGD
jgi:hypothetical protein